MAAANRADFMMRFMVFPLLLKVNEIEQRLPNVLQCKKK